MIPKIEYKFKHLLKRTQLNNNFLVTKGLIASSVTKLWDKNLFGEKIKIAVIDNGIYDHIDLKDSVIKRYNLTSEKEMFDSHGTHVAGIIASRGIFRGISPRSELIDIKIIDKTGTNVNLLNKALEIAIQEKVNIVNLSLGGADLTKAEIDLLSTTIKNAWNQGIICIAASGNEGSGVCNTEPYNFPAAIPRVESIASVKILNENLDYELSYFSNENNKVSLCSLGEDVISLYEKEDYAIMSGTSMATPHVTGFCSLIYQDLINKYPEIKGSRLSSLVTSLLHENTIHNKKSCLRYKYLDKSFGLGYIRYEPMEKIIVPKDFKPYYYNNIFLGYIFNEK